jgi:lipopolysaccharide/colanic/teichoic acid biosynthesis glycosyltransferase
MSSVSKNPELASHSVVSRTGALTRTFDFVCSLLGLIAASPLLAMIALAIKLDDGGPVFYSQERVGKSFRLFRAHKFRSMIAGADRQGLLTCSSDTRQTRVGRVLRRYKLDELPQLFNVLNGQMQLVGARPEVERYVQMFRPQYSVLLQDRPGITDPASLAYRHEDQILSADRLEQQYVREVLPAKLTLSLDYQQRRTFLSDIGILFRTMLKLFE